jgi:hypothetical protein
MNLGWKILMPMALLNVVATAIIGVVMPTGGMIANVIMFAFGVVVVVVTTVIAAPKHAKRSVRLVRAGTGN